MIRIAHCMPHTRSEGPGERFAIWVQGCSIQCPKCCNPEMFAPSGGTLFTVDSLLQKVIEAENEGVSFLGGEPFDQPEKLGELTKKLQENNIGVMVFSGYTLKELQAIEKNKLFLEHIDLLKAGRYNYKLHSTRRKWIGSENQQLHFLTDRYKNHPDIEENNTQSVTIDLSENGIASGWPGFFEV